MRKERKQHGLQRWVEGPLLEPGERCLIVEDVVTTGGSTVKAIERVREEGFEIAGGARACSTAWRAAPRRSRRRGGRALPAAHDDRRRLSGPPPRLGEPAVDQPPGDRVRRREHDLAAPGGGGFDLRALEPAHLLQLAVARARVAAAASALKPIISELGNGQGCEAT